MINPTEKTAIELIIHYAQEAQNQILQLSNLVGTLSMENAVLTTRVKELEGGKKDA